jgi:hypothetical protein
MSTLVAQTISNGTVSTSTENCIQGSAKAWVNFDGTGTVAIRASYNVSSITDNGTGDYTVNFTNALPDANYSSVATLGGTTVVVADLTLLGVTAPTTTAIRIGTRQTTSGILVDCAYVCVSVFD